MASYSPDRGRSMDSADDNICSDPASYTDCSASNISIDTGEGSPTTSKHYSSDGQSVAADVQSRKWNESQRALLTSTTAAQMALLARREKNRLSAQKSRQKKKDREPELRASRDRLNSVLNSVQQQLSEWRVLNLSIETEDARLVEPSNETDSNDMAECVNSVYDIVLKTLKGIAELQLRLDEITEELNSLFGPP